MLMQIDGTILFVIISFMIFLFIIKTILYRPFSKIIDERNNFYEKNTRLENESNEKSKKLLEEKENKLRQTKKEASELLKNSQDKIKQESDELLKEINKNSLKKIEENQNYLSEEINKTKKEIKPEINSIVSLIASKVLGEKIDVDIDDNQIEKYLKI